MVETRRMKGIKEGRKEGINKGTKEGTKQGLRKETRKDGLHPKGEGQNHHLFPLPTHNTRVCPTTTITHDHCCVRMGGGGA